MSDAGAVNRSGHAVASAWRWLQALLPSYLLVILALLLLGKSLGSQAGTLFAIVTTLVLGVPHGALDAEIARPWLRPNFGRLWFGLFAIPYLFLAAAVLIAWRLAPSETLAVFLCASVCHFGLEDTGVRSQATPLLSHITEILARGGLPVTLPTLLHPSATAQFLGTISLVTMPQPPDWLAAASWAWCPIFLYWAGAAIRTAQWPRLIDALLVTALFALLPPLTAFAAYFVCLHAPRHMAALIHHQTASRVQTMQGAILRSLPVTALTLAIGAMLWPWFPGRSFADRLLTLTFQGLAALTLPHMLQESVIEHLPATRQLPQ